MLHAGSMGPPVRARRIDFIPGAVGDASGRWDAAGWGLIQLYFGHLDGRRLRPSHTNHNTEARARRWAGGDLADLGPVDAWDWREVARVSRRLIHRIRAMAVMTVGSRPVLPAAAQAVHGGRVDLMANPDGPVVLDPIRPNPDNLGRD
jgi:hypothetical protein